MTPDQSRKVGTGVAPASPAPFLTPKPERRRPDSRGSEWNSYRQDRDKEVNVQVLLRCRLVYFYSSFPTSMLLKVQELCEVQEFIFLSKIKLQSNSSIPFKNFRPLSDDEQRLNVPRAVTCNDSKREVTVLQNVANKQVDRVFTFDKVLFLPSTFSSFYFSRNTMLLYIYIYVIISFIL